MTHSPTRWRKLTLSHSSVFRNLAVEEALARALSAKTQTQPTFRVWTNPEAVVLGRFQEAPAEVDIGRCESNDVQIARRFTGGGTVFQDEATLNLTLAAQPQRQLRDVTFQETNLRLVKDALKELGIRCSLAQNSILVDRRKVCGAAAAVGLNFTLWHCSILVDADTDLLEAVLSPSKTKAAHRFVHSRWQKVTTLSRILSKPVGVDEVASILQRTLETRTAAQLEAGPLSPEEEMYSEALYSAKYSSLEWNLKGNRGFTCNAEGMIGFTRQLPYASAQHPSPTESS